MAKIKYYRNNPLLKGVGVQLQYTAEQVEEYIKCKNDPIYFIKNYVKIVDVDYGLVKFDLFDYQEEFIDLLHKNNKVIGAWARQMGKCCLETTRVLLRNNKYDAGREFEITIGEFYQWLLFVDGLDKSGILDIINSNITQITNQNNETNNRSSNS